MQEPDARKRERACVRMGRAALLSSPLLSCRRRSSRAATSRSITVEQIRKERERKPGKRPLPEEKPIAPPCSAAETRRCRRRQGASPELCHCPVVAIMVGRAAKFLLPGSTAEIQAAAVAKKLLTELLPGRVGVAAVSLCYFRISIQAYMLR
ncbi:uncharacterized protein LOC107495943 [Arachis duranensis]|uniref:Uncharacterized protein LOC107495943 n=1 Tax=Arachis duranensis TaxID=130453 RepID=A0A9C6T4B8_ARADU|nr:uncharacterized protein LOC107495943 [Arachis duranensis]